MSTTVQRIFFRPHSNVKFSRIDCFSVYDRGSCSWCVIDPPGVVLRGFATKARGPRGARGRGWYVKFRDYIHQENVDGDGSIITDSNTDTNNDPDSQTATNVNVSPQRPPNRHLQNEYVEGRMNAKEAVEWNKAILSLGSTAVYMDLTLSHQQQEREESHRLIMDLATTVIPDATQTFIDLLPRYEGTKLIRYEKQVGWCGGERYLTRNVHEIELPDPRPLWHIPSAISMLQRDCINGQFLFITHTAPHLDGIHISIGMARNMEKLGRWASGLVTVKGVPTTHDLIISSCGILSE